MQCSVAVLCVASVLWVTAAVLGVNASVCKWMLLHPASLLQHALQLSAGQELVCDRLSAG